MNNIKLSSDLINEIEAFEVKAWMDLYQAAPHKTAKEIGIKIFQAGDSFATTAACIDILALNRIIGLGLKSEIKEDDLFQLKNKLDELNIRRFFIQLHPNAKPKNAQNLLEANSFYYYNNWVKLVRDNSPAPSIKSSAEIKEVDINYSKVFADILLKSFEWPMSLSPWIANTFGRKNWKHYIAFFEGKAVGTGLTFAEGNFAWIAFAATLSSFRNKGIQSALLARRINDSICAGAEYLIIETAENKPDKPSASYRNVIRAGFKPAYLRKNYLYKSAGL